MSIFGLSLGASKSKSSTTQTEHKVEDVNQTQTGAKSETTTGSTNTTQTGATTNAGTSTTQQSGATTGTQSTTGAQTGTTTSFSADVLKALTGLALGGIGAGGSSAAKSTLTDQLAGLGTFNPAEYVAGVKADAQAKGQEAIDVGTGTTGAQIGGTESTNSMAALLGNRIRTNTNASVASTVAQAEQNAAQIVQGNVQTANQAVGTENSFLTQILDQLKGGVTTQAVDTKQGTTTAGTSATSGSTATTEAGTSTQNTGTTSTQNVASLIEQLLQGTTTTDATGSSTTKGSKIGGGMSLSL